MDTLKARVKNGRLVMDVPTDLPEGTIVDLVLDDAGDDLSDEEREALDRFLAESLASAQSGESILASELIEQLRKRQ